MKLRDAKKLHNGDEVIDKNTNESVKVLSTEYDDHSFRSPVIWIKGIGNQQGWATWIHRVVK